MMPVHQGAPKTLVNTPPTFSRRTTYDADVGRQSNFERNLGNPKVSLQMDKEVLKQVLTFFVSTSDENNSKNGSIVCAEDEEQPARSTPLRGSGEEAPPKDVLKKISPDEWKYVMIGMQIGWSHC
jgi:hypothetical protein